MLRYQVNRCNEIGFKLLLMLMFMLVTWQALTPAPLEATQSINDKLGHALVFLMLSAVTDHAFTATGFSLRKIAYLLLYGIAIECIQYYVPGRDFSLLDILADAAGIFFFWFAARFIFVRELTLNSTDKNF